MSNFDTESSTVLDRIMQEAEYDQEGESPDMEGEAIDYGASGEVESDVVRHPQLGYGSALNQEQEFDQESDFEAPGGVITHPLLGAGTVISGESELEPELEPEIIAPDQRVMITATTRVPFRFICRLELHYRHPTKPGQTVAFAATGTLISARHILTAGHCVYTDVGGKNQEVRKVIVRPGQAGPTAIPFGAVTSRRVSYTSGWKKSQSVWEDYAIITLSSPIAAKKFASLGNKPLGCWGDPANGGGTRIVAMTKAAATGVTLNVAGYPGDKCGAKSMKTDPRYPGDLCGANPQVTACPFTSRATTLWIHSGNAVTPAGVPTHPDVLRYNMDTCAGHSGSPVWTLNNGVRTLVGVHTGGSLGKGHNRGTLLTPKVLNQIRFWMK